MTEIECMGRSVYKEDAPIVLVSCNFDVRGNGNGRKDRQHLLFR